MKRVGQSVYSSTIHETCRVIQVHPALLFVMESILRAFAVSAFFAWRLFKGNKKAAE